MKMVKIDELDWFHTMVWNEAVGIYEYRENEYRENVRLDVRPDEIRRAMNRRFIDLRGYLPWNRPELMPDLGPKLNQFWSDFVDECYRQICRGEVIFAY